jgi:nucleoside-diphosphate-sugar epimerase
MMRAAEVDLAGTPVNVGSGVGIGLCELAARVQSMAGPNVGLRILPGREVEVTRYVADVSRMRSLLGVNPPVDPLSDLEGLWDGTEVRAA